MSAEENVYSAYEINDDAFDEPVRGPALEPTRETKQSVASAIRLVKLTTQTIKDFTKDYPNSYVIVSTRSHGLLRLDSRRGTKYEVMLVPSGRDEIENLINKGLIL